MSRHPSSADAFDFLISAMLAVVAVLAAFTLATAFQTLPTATTPHHFEDRNER